MKHGWVIFVTAHPHPTYPVFILDFSSMARDWAGDRVSHHAEVSPDSRVVGECSLKTAF